MKNILLFALILTLSHTALSQRKKSELSAGAAGKVVSGVGECAGIGCSKKTSQIRGSYEAFPLKHGYFKPSKRGANCDAYIHRNSGELGTKGKKLQSLMSKYPVFYQAQPSTDLASVCPKFSRFTKDQKTHFWVWFWAALALDETTCGKDNRAQGVNDIALGDFQMEESTRLRASRPAPCRGAKNMSNFDNNAACAVAIMDQQLRSRKKVFNTTSYWQKLNRGVDVKTLVQKYPACR